MPRVGVDLRGTEQGFKAHFGRGTGRYAEQLARHLRELATEGLTLVELTRRELSGTAGERRLVQLLPFGKMSIETQFLLPRRIGNQALDLMHFLAHGDAPATLRVPFLVTVLDLIPLRFAELYRAERPGWRFRLARSLELQAIRNARGILAISEATKRDVVELLGVAPEKIAVTPLAVDTESFAPPESEAEHRVVKERIRQELNLPGDRKIVLYVGGIDPRKNVPFLLRVFAAIISRAEITPPPQLVLVGGIEGDRQYSHLQSELDRLRIRPYVTITGRVSDEALVKYYHGADLMVYPSLYEGFGLPILEAMAAGCPVVAPRNSSIPEVAGEGYPLLGDGDEREWVVAIEAALRDEGRSRALREAGLRRAPVFSWRRTAEETLRAYRQFLQVKSSS